MVGRAEGRSVPEARRVAKQVVPLALLAAVRALSTAATGYHVPVGEYGRHWNFFATLAVVTAVAHVAPLPTGHSATAGALTLAAAHQWALTGPGARVYALDHERGPRARAS